MTYNTLIYAKILETGDIRMVLAVDPHFEGNGKAYCLKMTESDIKNGLQPTEWYSATLVELVDQEKPYTCISCSKPLDFPHTFFHYGQTYCSDCLYEYSKESEGW